MESNRGVIYSEFRTVFERFNTFREWNGSVGAFELAENGFIFLSQSNQVECVLCHIVIDCNNLCLEDGQRHDPKCLTIDPTDSDFQDCDADPSDIEEHKLCKVCYSREMSVVFMPCKHLICCERCASKLTECAYCRFPIDKSQNISISWMPNMTTLADGSKDSSSDEATLCKTCHKNEMCMVSLPCKHVSSCETCAVTSQNCVVCQDLIQENIRIFICFL